MLRTTFLCLLVYLFNVFLFIECKDGEIAVSLKKSSNYTQCTVAKNYLKLKEHALVAVNVTSETFVNLFWIELPDHTEYHNNPKAGGRDVNMAIATHAKLNGEWTFVILYHRHNNVMDANQNDKYWYNGSKYLKATCTATVDIETKNTNATSDKNNTDADKSEGRSFSHLPGWFPIPAILALAMCIVVIILQTVMIVHFKRKARGTLPYNSLVKKSEEDIDSAVRYSSHPVQKKNVTAFNRGSGVYEDPNISFANGRPPPAGPPPNIPPSNGLPLISGPPNIPVPDTPRATHLDISKKMLPILPPSESIPKLNATRNVTSTQLLGKSSPMDVESSIANRPPLPLPKEEVYESMESELPDDYQEPESLEFPQIQTPPKTVAASPKPCRTAKKPKPMLPPPEKKNNPANGPMVNELNAALKQRAANAGISQVPQKPTNTPKSPNPMLSPPPVRHKVKTSPTPRQNPQGFEEPSQLRLRPKPKALLPTEQQTQVTNRKAPAKAPVAEGIYNESEGYSDSEEKWEYEALKPDRYYMN